MAIRKENNKPGSAKPAGVNYFMRRNALGTRNKQFISYFVIFLGTLKNLKFFAYLSSSSPGRLSKDIYIYLCLVFPLVFPCFYFF